MHIQEIRIERRPLWKMIRRAMVRFSADPHVVGIDVGFKYISKDGCPQRSDRVVLRLHVDRKLRRSEVARERHFSQVIGSKLWTDVMEVKPVILAEELVDPQRDDRREEIQAGISISQPYGGPGTLGAIVFDRETGQPGLLSCFHVLAHGPHDVGLPVLQPALSDGGHRYWDRIAQLSKILTLEEGSDAAFATLLDCDRDISLTQLGAVDPDGRDIRITKAYRLKLADIGCEVGKSGRTTGVTYGIVDGIGTYFVRRAGRRYPIKGFRIVPSETEPCEPQQVVSQGGDSGSLIYLKGTNRGVGLLFDGDRDWRGLKEHALACHLKPIMRVLDLSFVPPGGSEMAGTKEASS